MNTIQRVGSHPVVRAITMTVQLIGAPGLAMTAVAQTPPVEVRLPPPTGVASMEFSRPSSMRELPDGRVLVADRLERRVILLQENLASNTSTEIGRLGQGPEEFESVHLLHPLGADSTLLTDTKAGRWHFIAGGKVVGSTRPMNRLVEFLGQNISGADTLGHVLGVRGYSPGGPEMASGRLADSLLLLLGDRASGTVVEMARLKGQGFRPPELRPASSVGPRMLVTGNPLHSEDQALLFPDGWIAVAYVNPYRVSWRSPSGAWVHGPANEYRKIRVTDDEKCFALARYVGTHIRCDPSLTPDWPDVLPPFVFSRQLPDLFAAPGGYLAIKRTQGATDPGLRYDFFDRRGVRVAVLSLGPEERILGFGRSSVYIVTRDEATHLHRLRRHPWPVT